MAKGPLDGFLESVGIFTPQQKRALMLEQAAQQQQTAMYQQQAALMQSKNAESFGFNAGLVHQGAQELGGMAGAALGKKMGRVPAPQQDMGTGAEIILGNGPPDGKMSSMLLGMAKQMWQTNPQGAFLTYQKALELQQQELEDEAKNDTANRAAAQAGNPGNMESFRDAKGNIVTTRQQKGPLGEYVGDQEMGRGPNRQESQTFDDPRTDATRSKELQEFIDYARNTDASLSVIDQLRQHTLGENEDGTMAPVGWTASGVSFVDKVTGTLRQIANLTGTQSDFNEKALRYLENPSNFQKLASTTGVSASLWGDLVGEIAKLYNPTGVITEKDIKRAEEVVGRNIGNPSTLVSVLDHLMKERISGVERRYSYLSTDSRESEVAKEIYSTFQLRNTRAEGEDSGTPTVSTAEEYAELESGDEYIDGRSGKRKTKK